MPQAPLIERGNVSELRPARGIKALRFKLVEKGALVGFCDLHVEAWSLTLCDCKLFKKNGTEWIGMPSSSYTNKDGKTVYKDLVEFTSDEASNRFQDAALKALSKFRGI